MRVRRRPSLGSVLRSKPQGAVDRSSFTFAWRLNLLHPAHARMHLQTVDATAFGGAPSQQER
jgi:hypothetical protein